MAGCALFACGVTLLLLTMAARRNEANDEDAAKYFMWVDIVGNVLYSIIALYEHSIIITGKLVILKRKKNHLLPRRRVLKVTNMVCVCTTQDASAISAINGMMNVDPEIVIMAIYLSDRR